MGKMSDLDIEEKDLREKFFNDDKLQSRMTFPQYLRQQAPEIFKLTGGKKAGGKIKGLKNGGLARRKRSIARGCGAIMENKRKKTLYT
tara:strand:+ start:179 stop:442 length:264 start_codon:yes stop_codon:yes gene_type:complete